MNTQTTQHEAAQASRTHENIIAVPRSLIEALGYFTGFQIDPEMRLLRAALTAFLVVPRNAETENDTSLKQIVHYGLVLQGNKVLKYRRCKRTTTEVRLAGKASLGIGGHLNDNDVMNVTLGEILATATRELHEELLISGSYSHRAVALLNDDSTPENAVHLGVIHVFDLAPETTVQSNEQGITEVEFLTWEDVAAMCPELETWSQFVLFSHEHLIRAARK